MRLRIPLVPAALVALLVLPGALPAAALPGPLSPVVDPAPPLVALVPQRVLAGVGGATYEGQAGGLPVLCRATVAFTLAQSRGAFAASQDVPAVLGTQGVCQALLTQRYHDAAESWVSLPADRLETAGGAIVLRGTRELGAQLLVHLWLRLEPLAGDVYRYHHTIRSADGSLTLDGEGTITMRADLRLR